MKADDVFAQLSEIVSEIQRNPGSRVHVEPNGVGCYAVKIDPILRPATAEEIEAQRAGIAASANIKGERNCVPAPHPYVSIDIETTGLDESYCQILEFGAVIEDWVSPVENLQRFHRYVVHDQIEGEPFALAMNAEILRRIANHEKGYVYVKPHQLAGEFQSWLMNNKVIAESSQRFVAAGKNFAKFDLQFLKRLPGWNVKIHHRSIDPAMFFWKPSVDAAPPDSKTCMERARISGEVAHTAVEDAITVIKMVRDAFDSGEPFFDACADVSKSVSNLIWEGEKPTAKDVAKKLADHFVATGQIGNPRRSK